MHEVVNVMLCGLMTHLPLLSLNILGILGRTWRRIKFCTHDSKCCPRSMGAPLLNLLSPGFFIKEKMWSQSLVIYLDISPSRIYQTFCITEKKNSVVPGRKNIPFVKILVTCRMLGSAIACLITPCTN